MQCLNPGLIEISGAFYFTNITPSNGGFNDIVQIGMGTCRAPNCVAGMRFYSGWGRTKSTPGCSAFSNRAPTATDEGAWSSASHEYKVFHQANEWKLLVDGTKLLGVPEASICWTPSQAVWFAESWDFGDQIGGVDTNRFLVTSLKYANAEGGAFEPTTLNAANACNYGGAGNPFFCDITGATSLSMWTNR